MFAQVLGLLGLKIFTLDNKRIILCCHIKRQNYNRKDYNSITMKTKLLIVLLALFGLTALSDAQEVSRSGREKGFVIRPEIGITSGWESKSNQLFGYFLQGSFVYNFNANFNAGIGTGAHYYEWNHVGEKDDIFSLPIYANIRIYFCNKKVSPFFDFKIGYNIPLSEGKVIGEEPESVYHNVCMKIKGLYGLLSLGLQVKKIDVGMSIGWTKGVNYYKGNVNLDSVEEYPRWYFMPVFSIAYNFQFKQSF